jgi:hypothetical protein
MDLDTSTRDFISNNFTVTKNDQNLWFKIKIPIRYLKKNEVATCSLILNILLVDKIQINILASFLAEITLVGEKDLGNQ